MHFESTASFTNHGSTPFVDCEKARLMIEPRIYLLPWIKHEHCHARVLNQAVENSASLACHLDPAPHCHVGQHVHVIDDVSRATLIGRSMLMDQSYVEITDMAVIAIRS